MGDGKSEQGDKSKAKYNRNKSLLKLLVALLNLGLVQSQTDGSYLEIKGFMGSYNASAGYLTIIGMPVETVQAHVFGPKAQGTWVEVRGNWVGNGLQANRVEVAAPSAAASSARRWKDRPAGAPSFLAAPIAQSRLGRSFVVASSISLSRVPARQPDSDQPLFAPICTGYVRFA